LAQSLASLHLHIVFSTWRRTEWIDDGVRPELHAYIAGTLRNIKCAVQRMNSVEDHIHILMQLHRTKAVADVLEEIKSSSSRWIKSRHERFADFKWQAGYGAFAVSSSNVAAVCRYIDIQREHHQARSFQDEYREILRRHGVAYDEQYVWD